MPISIELMNLRFRRHKLFNMYFDISRLGRVISMFFLHAE